MAFYLGIQNFFPSNCSTYWLIGRISENNEDSWNPWAMFIPSSTMINTCSDRMILKLWSLLLLDFGTLLTYIINTQNEQYTLFLGSQKFLIFLLHISGPQEYLMCSKLHGKCNISEIINDKLLGDLDSK